MGVTSEFKKLSTSKQQTGPQKKIAGEGLIKTILTKKLDLNAANRLGIVVTVLVGLMRAGIV